MRLPISPSPQGDATKWSLIMIRTGFQRVARLLFNKRLLVPSEFLIKFFIHIKQIKHI